MSKGFAIRDQTLSHFITATAVDWVDVFTRKSYRDCVIESLNYSIENKGIWSKLDYIHLNRVRAGIVERASQYIYSSASNYVLNEGLLKIEKADIPIIDVLNLNNFTRYTEY